MSSRRITSNQQGIHQRLQETVAKHLHSEFRRPFAAHSQRSFEQYYTAIDGHRDRLIFDSYCGVGESSVHIAQQFPEAFVVGLDQSAHRLGKHDEHYTVPGVDNYLLIRADVDDFWRLALQAGWRLQQHFLLYPNPWPKSSQLKRRCHGSPLFPTLLNLGGVLELRSNWPLYIEEFSAALDIAEKPHEWGEFEAESAITPFERKYRDSGQPLWRLRCELD